MNDEEKLNDLEAIFNPRSIAIAGASEDRGKIGTKMFQNFIGHGCYLRMIFQFGKRF